MLAFMTLAETAQFAVIILAVAVVAIAVKAWTRK